MYNASIHRTFPLSRFLGLCFIIFQVGSTFAAEYWVNKAGRDSNGCTNAQSDACLTIQRGISVLSAGDTLNIGSGIYRDVGSSSGHTKQGTPAYFSSTPTNTQSFMVVFDRSGVAGSPIIVQADPASAEPVVIDAGHIYGGTQTYRGCIFMNYQDYIHIKNLTLRNCHVHGIANWDHSGDVPQQNYISENVLIEGMTIHHVGGGDNDAGIAMWSTRNWTVRNNYIHDIYGWPPANRAGTGIMSYGTIAATIEHNLILNSRQGIFWKDHYVANATTREPVFESEIRYNLIKVSGIPVMIGIQPDNEAGENYIHHNILVGAGGAEDTGIRILMSGVEFPTIAPQRIEHNLIIGSRASDSSGIKISGVKDVRLKGNIVHNFKRALESQYVSPTMPAAFTQSNYNVFGNVDEVALLTRYSSTNSKAYSSLSSWKAAQSSDSASLSLNSPDSNSVWADINSVIADYVAENYKLASGSPAIRLMPDGSNAGPYQKGNEVIGLLGKVQLPSQAAPVAPNLSIQVDR